MTKAYEKGFMDKCAECGVDGVRLLKRAQAALGKVFDVGAWWPKYIDLLKGGAKQRKAIALAFKNNHAGASLKSTLKNTEGVMNELTGRFQRGLIPKENYLSQLKPLIKDYNEYMAPLTDLERNVALARLGTGGALAAGGLYGLDKMTRDDYDGYSARRPVRPHYV